MATLTLSSAVATRTMTLGTTVGLVVVPVEQVALMSGLYLYSSSEVLYQILPDGGSLTDGATAPTTDYAVIPASTLTPIPLPGRAGMGLGVSGAYTVAVWVASATPTLHVAPYPVTR